MNLYFDNASTSFPKPNNVINSVNNFITNIGASANRGYYKTSLYSSKILFKCRESLCQLFNYNKPENIIFTYNATYAFNLLINSLINSTLFKTKPHILYSNLDHNCTIRPLLNLKNKNLIELDYIDNDSCNFIDTNNLVNKIKYNTKFLIISHMSNVTGNIQNLISISKICKKYKIFFIIDAAQSSGILNIDLSKLYFSAFFFTGHKNLFSIHGVGGLIISDNLLEYCENYFLGGTGSESYKLVKKNNMPDYFEAGTHNTIGILSMLNGINFINSIGIENIFQHKKYLLKLIYNEIRNIDTIKIINDINLFNQNSTICLNFKNIASDKIVFLLDKYFKICARGGLHCSPETHKILGTFPAGCVRLSPGIFNNSKDIDFLVLSLYKLSKNSDRYT